YFKTRFGLRRALAKVGSPFILKASGKRLFHKSEEGIKKNVKNYTQAIFEFKNLLKIKNSKEVLVQKKISGKEFFLIIRKSSAKKYNLSLGTFAQNKNKESFMKLFTYSKKNIKNAIIEIEKQNSLSTKEKSTLEGFILESLEIAKKNKKIKEIIIDSFFIDGKHSTVVNSKIEF